MDVVRIAEHLGPVHGTGDSCRRRSSIFNPSEFFGFGVVVRPSASKTGLLEKETQSWSSGLVGSGWQFREGRRCSWTQTNESNESNDVVFG